jgi:hypothetical protein
MSLVDTAMYTVHLLFAGLWTGSVVFTSYAILPIARSGSINAEPLDAVAGKLRTLTRVSAVLLLVTGSHLAANRYTVETLTGSTGGHLVLTMIALWLVLTALIEIGAGKLTDGTNLDKVREPAREARRFFHAASVVAALLLIDAGLLAAYNLALF